MRESEYAPPAAAREQEPGRLKAAMRQARIEMAERTAVVVDLRDAALARLEMLNDELDPIFAEIPDGVTLFDRGLSRGDTPRLWVDMVAHVEMGRDKRVYRFLQDTRYGPRVLAETADLGEMAQSITGYVARRLVEREQALSADAVPIYRDAPAYAAEHWRRRRRARWRAGGLVLLGAVLGALLLLVVAWFLDPLVY